MFQKRRCQDPPPALHKLAQDCSDDDECQHKKDASYVHKKQHGPRRRSMLESLRLFLLTRRIPSTVLNPARSKKNAGCFLAVLLLVLLQASTNRKDKLHHHILSMKDAGYTAKPTMMGYYFTDVPSSSFTGKAQRIDPPKSRRAWMDLLHRRNRHHHSQHSTTTQTRRVEPMSTTTASTATMTTEELKEESNDYKHDKPKLTPDADTCQPQYEWQAKSFPACNSVHEHAMMGDRMFLAPSNRKHGHRSHHHQTNNDHSSNHPLRRRHLLEKTMRHEPSPQYQMLANGYWRDTWMMKQALGKAAAAASKNSVSQTDTQTEVVAFKTMRYQHDVTEKVLDKQRRDSLTSDRLQFSDQAIHMYAYCGTSALYEYAPGGDLYQFMEQYETSQAWVEAFSPHERFILAHNVTSALADLHNTETPDARHTTKGYPATAIVHADFNANQFVAVTPPQLHDTDTDSTTTKRTIPHFKLGDFNLARFVYWNDKNHHPCMIQPDGSGGTYRAPEEYAKERGRTEKLDIYSLGNLMYSIVTGHWPFDDLELKDGQSHATTEIKELVQRGHRPHINIDTKLTQSQDPHVQAMLAAIEMCWKQDPHDRASAREVEAFLAKLLLPDQQQHEQHATPHDESQHRRGHHNGHRRHR